MNILQFCAKCSQKMHMGKLIYRMLKPFYHSCMEYNKVEVDKAYKYLSQFSTDPNNSAICSNKIDDCAYELQIIIPAYNVEQYIEDCIESVLSQKTDCRYLCTIVNDGSTDNTRMLLDKFVHHPKIELIDQSNRGFSGARNRGLEHIKGKYVMFLDSDDKLVPGAINALMLKAKETKADIIEGGYFVFNNQQKIIYSYHHQDIISNKWFNLLYGYPWGKIYKAELFQNLHFPEKYWFEDTLMSLLIYPMCNKFATISEEVYMYRINPSGITATAKRKNKSMDSLWITWRLLKDRELLQLSNNEDLKYFILIQFVYNFKRIHSLNDKQIDEAVFLLSIYLYERYFNVKIKNNPIYKFLEKRDYQAFKLYCIFNS